MNTEAHFKDLFSRQSDDYSKYRPAYPDILFRYLSSLTNSHEIAWDCGTGNGQAAVKLIDYFKRVIATDPSAKQISAAQRHSKIEYRVGSAETSAFSEHSVDLITVAQAFHWFRQDEFFSEARRVLRPGGVVAFWCYGLAKITPAIDAVIGKLYYDLLGTFWEPERKLVEEGYKSVRLPFPEINPPPVEMTAEWSFEHLLGYLGTWSALQTCIQKTGKNPLEAIFPELQSAWGGVASRPIRWDLALRIGRKL